MQLVKLNCASCRKIVHRSKSRFNEAKKFGWKTYCSSRCQAQSFKKQNYIKCSNPVCEATFWRINKEIKKVKNSYCSRSCAAIINNSKSPKRKKKIVKNTCKICTKLFYRDGLFCSLKCKNAGQFISKEKIIDEIQSFYNKNGRIPTKKEFKHNHAGRERFGSWNNAIETAGFSPNPALFAEKHIARDGHKCDSLSEKIIDDWFAANNIGHERSVSYPERPQFTCDFVVGDYFIEFFGLENEHKKYTEIVKEKRRLAKRLQINLIEIKPQDIFPKNRLEKVLEFLSL
ncbi:MAG: hypothetical protein Q8P37_00475 [Candidatus Spechtbacteria bacterium]|nr:hypothetical protein [Candidatus Spechtbacteria bacterium]